MTLCLLEKLFALKEGKKSATIIDPSEADGQIEHNFRLHTEGKGCGNVETGARTVMHDG
jgi:hypothetical protein